MSCANFVKDNARKFYVIKRSEKDFKDIEKTIKRKLQEQGFELHSGEAENRYAQYPEKWITSFTIEYKHYQMIINIVARLGFDFNVNLDYSVKFTNLTGNFSNSKDIVTFRKICFDATDKIENIFSNISEKYIQLVDYNTESGIIYKKI